MDRQGLRCVILRSRFTSRLEIGRPALSPFRRSAVSLNATELVSRRWIGQSSFSFLWATAGRSLYRVGALRCSLVCGQYSGHSEYRPGSRSLKQRSRRSTSLRRTRQTLRASSTCGSRRHGRRGQHRTSTCRLHEAGFAPCPRCSAGPTSCKLRAVPMRARCENACGKLPSCRRA
jgi:hypothetical protein